MGRHPLGETDPGFRDSSNHAAGANINIVSVSVSNPIADKRLKDV
jgi:hypothetical protein